MKSPKLRYSLSNISYFSYVSHTYWLPMRTYIIYIYQTIVSIFTNKKFWYFVGPVVGMIVYYSYLKQLYVVDEILEGSKLRELTMDEKFVVRIIAPKQFRHLKKFIEKYSLCPCIYEIQVFCQALPYKLPTYNSFSYAHTHSKVSIINVPRHFIPPYFPIDVATEAIMLLDASVSISCEDLVFTHSVWRSSKFVPVGYIPRLHHIATSSSKGTLTSRFKDFFSNSSSSFLNGNFRNVVSSQLATSSSKHSSSSTSLTITHENRSLSATAYNDMIRNLYTVKESLPVIYRGGWEVWWQSAYSILLSKAIMFNSIDMKKMTESPLIQSFLQYNRKCATVLPSLWYNSIDRGAPIWVDIPMTVDRTIKNHYSIIRLDDRNFIGTNITISNLTSITDIAIDRKSWRIITNIAEEYYGDNKVYSSCVTGLVNVLGIQNIAYSSYKSVRAIGEIVDCESNQTILFRWIFF